MSRKVLIVDKSLYNRMILKDLLITHGYSVLEASSSDQAVELYKQSRPDLVAVDAALPDTGGAKTVRGIRLEDPTAALLMCGNRGQRQLVMEAMMYGAAGVLVRPFNERQVLRAVHLAIVQNPRPAQ